MDGVRDAPGKRHVADPRRIAESYGVREAAIAAYKRVAKDESPQGDIWRLTSRRLGQIK